MRSILLSLADRNGLVTGPIVESLPPEEITDNVERDLHSLCMQCKQTQAVSTVAAGDTVVLNLVSGLPKFHRKGLYLCVGTNLFDAELEASLPGKAVGDVYTISVSGQEVSVTLVQCLRTVIPEPSDALIAGLDLEGITTLEQYRLHTAQHHKAMYREYYLQYLASEYSGQWFDASSWEIDPEELEEFYRAAKRQHDLECKAHDTVFLENYPGQLEEMLREDALRYLQALLVDCLLSGKDPKDLEPDLDHVYARKAVMERIWDHVAEILDPYFTLKWEENT